MVPLPPQLAPVPVRLGDEYGLGDVVDQAVLRINAIGLIPFALPYVQAPPVASKPLNPWTSNPRTGRDGAV